MYSTYVMTHSFLPGSTIYGLAESLAVQDTVDSQLKRVAANGM